MCVIRKRRKREDLQHQVFPKGERYLGQGYWDVHNHILPGIDDGSCCMEETCSMLEAEYSQGIRNIVFTPHYRHGMFALSADDHEAVYKKVCERFGNSFPDMRFYLGCEYYADSRIMDKLRDRRFRMDGSAAVLVEFSTASKFETIKKVTGRLAKEGYTPVIAHVERYGCLYDSDSLIASLKGLGAVIQINSETVLGKSGGKAKRFVMSLIKDDLADIIASDAHNVKDRPVCMGPCIEKIEKKFGNEKAERLFKINPSRLID